MARYTAGRTDRIHCRDVAAPCTRGRSPLERRQGYSEVQAMLAIGVILVFVIAVGAINYFEFGRPD
jgi:hypothetical protein